MAGVNNFFLSWWYTPKTKLAIYGSGFDINQSTNPISSFSTVPQLTNKTGLSASVEEGYRFSNLITNHPVQSQLSVNDSIIPQPFVLTITGLLSAITPIELGSTGIGVSGSLDFKALGGAVALLIDLNKKKTGLSITTGLIYGSLNYFRVDNMFIEELYIPRTNEYGVASLKFQLTLKQLNLVTPEGQGGISVTTAGAPYAGQILA